MFEMRKATIKKVDGGQRGYSESESEFVQKRSSHESLPYEGRELFLGRQ